MYSTKFERILVIVQIVVGKGSCSSKKERMIYLYMYVKWSELISQLFNELINSLAELW